MADDFYSLKAFVSYGALTNNAYGVTSPIGELSLRSGTFAKDRAHFIGATDTSPQTSAELTIFSSKLEDGTPTDAPAELSALLVEIGAWAYKQAVDGVFTSSTDSFRDIFEAQFGAKTNDLNVGIMVTNGTIWMPSYITFFLDSEEVFTNPVPAGFENARSRLWFSDAAFKQQYDEYNIAFVAPVAELDDLFQYPLQVVNLLAERTPAETTELVAQVAGNSPYTILTSRNFKYYHLGNPLEQTDAYWTFVIWSEYGNNLDTMKIDLAAWILANSTHTREEWIQIFPDIFATTEFIITPLWNQYAIPNLTLEQALYSPTVKLEDARTFMRATAAGTGYTNQHVDDHMTFLSMPFKSLACICIGGPENRDEKYHLYDVRTDFIDVPTSSLDFDRQSEETRNWAMKMFAMLNVAESMSETTDMPAGMYRLKRLNADNEEILYVAASIYDVQYLVTAKTSLNTMFPPVDRSASPIVVSPDPTVTLTQPAGDLHFQLNVSAVGGLAPYSYSASSGDIQAGGEIDPVTGALDVTFQNYGTNQIDVTVLDARGFPLTVTYTVVCPPGT